MRLLEFFFSIGVAHALVGAPAAQATPPALSVWNAVPDAAASSDTLSLTDVLIRVKHGNALLRALPLRSSGAAAMVDQANAWPNPHVFLEAENVAGSYSGFEQSELSLWLSQEVELDGKRSKRASQAQGIADQTALDARTHAFDVYLETKSRYARVVHADQRVELTAAAESIVTELATSADARVRAGATLTADASLAAAALARVRMVIRDAEAERTRARIELSALWGDRVPFDEPVARTLPVPTYAIRADSVATWANVSPSVERLRISSATQRANVAVERSLRVPNLTIDAGARRVEADDASTFLFGLALPLPLWDRREGAIRAADAQLRAADLELQQARAETSSRIAGHVVALQRLRDRIDQTDTTLIPSLSAALDQMRTAYAIGRTSYTDLLEVQRTLIELQNDTNDMRLAIVDEIVAIERLAGRTIEELIGNE